MNEEWILNSSYSYSYNSCFLFGVIRKQAAKEEVELSSIGNSVMSPFKERTEFEGKE